MSQQLLLSPTINLSQIIDHHQDFSYDQLATIATKCQEQVETLVRIAKWHRQVDLAIRQVDLAIRKLASGQSQDQLRSNDRALDEHKSVEGLRRLFYLCDFSTEPANHGYAAHFQFGEFEFRLEVTTGPKFQLQVYEYELFGWTNLWPPTERRCQGCQDGILNQMGHMDEGGCLAESITFSFRALDLYFQKRFKDYFQFTDQESETFFQILLIISQVA